MKIQTSPKIAIRLRFGWDVNGNRTLSASVPGRRTPRVRLNASVHPHYTNLRDHEKAERILGELLLRLDGEVADGARLWSDFAWTVAMTTDSEYVAVAEVD